MKTAEEFANEHQYELVEFDEGGFLGTNVEAFARLLKEYAEQSRPEVSGSLPSVDEIVVMAVKISEMVEPPLTAHEQSFFIAGFCECVKWLGRNDR